MRGTASESLGQEDPVEQGLKCDKAREGGEGLIFELELWYFPGRGVDLFVRNSRVLSASLS